jgi:phosphate transport system ATP-binding protein
MNSPASNPDPSRAADRPLPMSYPPSEHVAPIQRQAPIDIAISVERLNLWYGAKQALFDITLPFYARRSTAIIGPSGCGKSTLLRSVNRMHEVNPGTRTSGKVELFGENLYAPTMDPTILRRRVGMIFQKSNPFPTMTVRENVLVGLRLNGVRDALLLNQRLEECLRMAALWDEVKDNLNRPGVSLSGGQQQRLCIARAIAMKPEVLLMDEPSSALDPIATAKIEELIHQLKREFTIIIVTHNMQQAARVSDYTAFMYLGRLVEAGPTDKIFSHPNQKQTEEYITGRFG